MCLDGFERNTRQKQAQQHPDSEIVAWLKRGVHRRKHGESTPRFGGRCWPGYHVKSTPKIWVLSFLSIWVSFLSKTKLQEYRDLSLLLCVTRFPAKITPKTTGELPQQQKGTLGLTMQNPPKVAERGAHSLDFGGGLSQATAGQEHPHSQPRGANLNTACSVASTLLGWGPPGDRWFSSLSPFSRVPFWLPILDPHPFGDGFLFTFCKNQGFQQHLTPGAVLGLPRMIWPCTLKTRTSLNLREMSSVKFSQWKMGTFDTFISQGLHFPERFGVWVYLGVKAFSRATWLSSCHLFL